MRHSHYVTGIAASVMMMLTGCIDDKYDLSDINTETEIKVNDLTIPVNLKEIKLDEVIEVDENDPEATIKYVTVDDKKYFAIEKGGSFHAASTTVERVAVGRPSAIEPIRQRINGQPLTSVSLSAIPAGKPMKYIIGKEQTEALYEVGKNGYNPVDPAIITLGDVKMEEKSDKLDIDIIFRSPDLADKAARIVFENLRLLLPEGMKAKSEQGTLEGNMLTIPLLEGNGNSITLHLTADEIDFRLDPDLGPEGIKVVNGGFEYKAKVGVLSGEMTVYPINEMTTLDTTAELRIDFDLSGFTVTKFSGKISYSSDIADISPVELGDLPDFLAGDETDIIMSNPQIVINVNNPAGEYGLSCDAGLTITAERENMEPSSQELSQFSIGCDRDNGPYTLVLAPDPENAVNVPALATAGKFTFPGLSRVLAGKGIPGRLNIALSSQQWPELRVHGDARDFPLGVELDKVEGEYTFLTLLALADGSTVVYEKKEDGWSDDDVAAINISSFNVTAEATTDLPCGVRLWIRPLDTSGNDIPIDNPEEAVAEISANAQNEPISITLKGDIRHLDGIHIIATARNFNGEPMLPSQTIKINNLRVKVTGTYTKEL